MRHRALLPVALVAVLGPPLLDALHAQPPQAKPSGAQGGSTDTGAPPSRGSGPGGQGGRGGGAGGAGGALGGVGGPARGRGPAGPAPRRADGSIILGSASATDKGIWLPGAGGFQTVFPEDAKPPMHDWARALVADRVRNQLEPHTRCKPSGVGRQFQTPYGVEILELPEQKRVYIFDIGGPHTYRTIYTDGRTHPTVLDPSFYGHSIGWWEGDTLVVDTVGFNEAFWMDRRGTPHSEQLHTVERFTRTDARTMRYELEIDDPSVYTAPWKGGFEFGWSAGEELFEYVCQQANYADTLMVGEHKSVDRTTPIVP